jgi:xanthine/uracil permease
MTIVIKGLIVVLLGVILFSLGSALFYLVREPAESTKVVKALSWRIGLSLVLFILLMAAFWMGWITPHSIA